MALQVPTQTIPSSYGQFFFSILKLRELRHPYSTLAIAPVVLTCLGALMVDGERNTGRLQELPERRGLPSAFLSDERTEELQVLLKLWAEGAGHGSRAARLRLGQEGRERAHVSVHSHPCTVLHRGVLLGHSSAPHGGKKRKEGRERI